MNFHKKIGFLAALLLTFGFGVPDSFAQTISISPNIFEVPEGVGTAVTVDVTLSPAPDDGTTVMVTVNAILDGGSIGSITFPATVAVTDDQVLTITPPQDPDADDETGTVLTSANGYTTQSSALTIDDDEGTLTVTVNPSSAGEGEATTVNASIALAGRDAPTVETLVTVNAMLDGSNIGTAVVTVTANNQNGSGQLIITPPQDDDDAQDEMGTVTASLPDYVTTPADLTIDDDEGSLTFDITSERLTEGGGAQSIVVNVSLDPFSSVEVTVTANLGGGIMVTETRTGDGQVTLSITPADDADTQDQMIMVTASTDGYITGSEEMPATQTVIVVDDDQMNVITIALDPTVVTEGEGAQDIAVSVTLNPAPFEDIVVNVSAATGGFTIASVPITVPANMATGNGTLSLPVLADDGNNVDDMIAVTATGSYTPSGEDPVEYAGGPVNILVKDTDKEDGTISLTFSATEVQEDAGATDIAVTVTLNPAPDSGTEVVLTATIGMDMHSSTTVTVPTTGTSIGALTITPTNDEANVVMWRLQ